jgi:O-antigen ligase
MEKINRWWNKYQIYFLYLFAAASAISISVMSVLLAVFLLFYFFQLKRNIHASPKDFVYFIVFYLWNSLTDLFNSSFNMIWPAFWNIWDKLGYVTVSVLNLDKDKVIKFLKILFWTNVIVIVYALLQKYLGFPVIGKNLFTGDMMRFKGYHSHPLRFAGYISTVCIVAFSFGFFYSKKFLYFAAIMFLGVILNGSRTYWFSVTIVMAVIALLKSFKTFVLTVVSIGLFVGISFMLFPELNKRVDAAFNSNDNEYSNVDLRKNFWLAGIETFEKSPVYGVGKGLVHNYLEPYKNKGLIDNVAHCHNSYITTAAETGIIGLGMFVFIIFYFLMKYFMVAKRSGDDFIKAFGFSLFACWLNIGIGGMFESNFSTFVIWGFLSLWMGMFEALVKPKYLQG